MEAARRSADPTLTWILRGWAVLGLVCVGVGCVGGVRQARFADGASATDGVVVGRQQTGRETARLVVRYQVGGEPHEVTSRRTYLPWEYPVGAGVRVRYRPERPASAQLDTFAERWLPAVGYGGCGAVLAVLAAVSAAAVARRARKTPNQALQQTGAACSLFETCSIPSGPGC